MRWSVFAMAIGSAVGCGGDEAGDGDEAPQTVVCTATRAPLTEESVSTMDGRGLPLETRWSDYRGLISETTYVYDEAGRLIERRTDLGSTAQAPDGDDDVVTAVIYAGATAELIETDRRAGTSRRVGGYTFDDQGRPIRVEDSHVRTYQYDAEGRVRAVDEQGSLHPISRSSEYTFGADGRPALMHVEVDGLVYDLTLTYEESPNVIVVRPSPADGPQVAVHRYEHDEAGRLTRAEGLGGADTALEITYGADGSVSVLRGASDRRTYSAGCGVRLEVPHGRALPRGPAPTSHAELPEIPTIYVIPSSLAI